MTVAMRIASAAALAILALAAAVGASAADDEDGIELPDAVVDPALAAADCDLPDENDGRDGPQDAEDLGGGLKLVAVNCVRAAYNFAQIFFVVDPDAPERARLLSFDTLDGEGGLMKVHTVSNAYYDRETKVLSESHKLRGAGDCGSIARYGWNGSEFELKAYWSKSDCDGEPWDFEEDDEQAIRRWRLYPKGG